MLCQIHRSILAIFVFAGLVNTTVHAQRSEVYATAGYGGNYNPGALVKMDGNLENLEVIYEFPCDNQGPPVSLYETEDHRIYGLVKQVLVQGSIQDLIFEWDPIIETYSIIVVFNDSLQGKDPVCFVALNDEKILGSTSYGGKYDCGVLFELDLTTGSYSKSHDFNCMEDGGNPMEGCLYKGFNGKVYGLTRSGGANDLGTLFEWDPDSSSFKKKLDIVPEADLEFPGSASLIYADGYFYWSTTWGGEHGFGELYSWNPDTDAYEILMDYESSDQRPSGDRLCRTKNGILYGSKEYGGDFRDGYIYELNPLNASYTVKYSFNGEETGKGPKYIYIQDNGNLYGQTRSSGTYKKEVLFEFNPENNLYKEKADYIVYYSSTQPLFPSNRRGFLGIASRGTVNTNYLFHYDLNVDTLISVFNINTAELGGGPVSIIHAPDGYIYGVCRSGGKNGLGTLFQWSLSEEEITVRHHFAGDSLGRNPYGLIKSEKGNIFLMTLGGYKDKGTIYEWDPLSGLFSKVFQLDSIEIESYVNYSWILDSKHRQYGILKYGGIYGNGVVFRWDSNTRTFMEIFDLNDFETDYINRKGMIYASNEKIYGTSSRGGQYNDGILFEFDPVTGAYERRGEFGKYPGKEPNSSLTEAKDGTLYGGTSEGGGQDDLSGILFAWDPADGIFHRITSSYFEPGGPSNLFCLENGNVYGYTGTSLFEWNPASKAFSIKQGFKNMYFGRSSRPIEIINRSFAEITASACDRYVSPSGRHSWTQSGTYTDTILNSTGGDSVITVNLTIQLEAPKTLNVESCQGEPTPVLVASGDSIRWYSDYGMTSFILQGDSLFTGEFQPGTFHFFATQTVSGCQSAPDTATLTIFPKPAAPLALDTFCCDGEVAPPLFAFGDSINWYGEPGYSDYLANGSVFHPGLLPAGQYFFYATQSIKSCEGYESTATLDVKTGPVINLGKDTTLNKDDFLILGPFPNDYYYQWNDGSDKPFQVIYEEDLTEGQHLVSVEVWDGECSYSDSIYIVINKSVAIDEREAHHGVLIYPNPTKDGFSMMIKKEIPGDFQISIYNSSGILVDSRIQHNYGARGSIISNIPVDNPGIYYVFVSGPGIKYSQKLIRQ